MKDSRSPGAQDSSEMNWEKNQLLAVSGKPYAAYRLLLKA